MNALRKTTIVAVAVLLALVIPIMLFQYFQNKAQEAPK